MTLNDTVDPAAKLVSAFRDKRALVLGDAILDEYLLGDCSRISPEAPVPVVKIARSEERPGGAANVARNVAALGATALLLSVTGDDEPGTALERLLSGERVTGDSDSDDQDAKVDIVENAFRSAAVPRCRIVQRQHGWIHRHWRSCFGERSTVPKIVPMTRKL